MFYSFNAYRDVLFEECELYETINTLFKTMNSIGTYKSLRYVPCT